MAYYRLAAKYFVDRRGRCRPRDRRPTASQKRAVWRRDGGKCVLCGRALVQYRPSTFSDDEQGHVDHILPVARGGSSDLRNMRLVCATTNLSRKVDVGNAWRTCG